MVKIPDALDDLMDLQKEQDKMGWSLRVSGWWLNQSI